MSGQLHRISDVDTERKVALCAICGPDSTVVYQIGGRGKREYWRCQIARTLERAPESRREDALKLKFGITSGEYDQIMTQQNGVCAICSQVCMTSHHLCVDHDHATGKIRGLLCGRCNRAIGLMDDDPTRFLSAITYLTQPTK